MTKQELREVIASEVQRQLKIMVPALAKSLVQESVAGALASLLAEGIVKGAPRAASTPPSTHATPTKTSSRSAPRFNRNHIARELGYGDIEPIGDGSVGSILAETAVSMRGRSAVDTPSVLDAVDQIDGVAGPEVVDALTRDYSELMSALSKKKNR